MMTVKTTTAPRLTWLLALASFCWGCWVSATEHEVGTRPDETARKILDTSGVQGGVIVQLGCDDGRLAAALGAGEAYVVQALGSDKGDVEEAREHIKSRGLYGKVSACAFDGRRLPYADNLVNLVVAKEPGGISMDEVMRVLAPRGVAIIDGRKSVKPWPKDIDTWPQYLNKADNNAVAMDSIVGPPRRIQWIDTPTWSRSHMGIATVVSMVTCNGRMFSIEDRALPDNPFLPGRFTFVARDAFNGRTLWTRKIERWESITVYIKSLPTQQQRRMVATDDVLYCTPVLEGPLAALDAATGKTLRTFDDISPVQEVAYDRGILFVNVGERFNASAYNQTHKKSSGLGGTPGEPFNGSGFRRGYAPEIKDKETAVSHIVAIDPATGRSLWKTENLKNYTGASFAVKGDHAVYQTGEGMFCIDPKTGKTLWSVKKTVTNAVGGDSHTPGTMPNTVIITDDMAFAVEGKELYAYSLDKGKVLWQSDPWGNYQASVDLFYVNGILWIGAKAGATGIDAKTGKLVKTLTQQITGPMGHDRCYRNYITKKFYINSKTGGADFLDLDENREYPNHWTRGTCGMGVLPANGLLYAPPYSCTCSIGDMMPGLNAYRTDSELLESRDAATIKREVRLEKGPAYGDIQVSGLSRRPSLDWPTYRGNPFRGGMTDRSIGARLEVKWQAKLPGKPTASTIADGKVYVCVPDTHTLHALESSSGKPIWTFTADGRIDSPPTYHKGMVLFGSRDGWLYCLRASDGVLCWRFKDLPDRLIGAFGQLESAWPISGAVLVLDDKVYASAGRSSFLDGGIFLYCLDPITGKILKSRSAYGPFAANTGFPIAFRPTGIAGAGKRKGKGKGKEKGKESSTITMAGFKNGVLTSDGTAIYLRHQAFDKDLAACQPKSIHLMPLGGFLDRRVQHRTGFVLNSRFQWWRNEPKDIMISDGQETYAIAGFQSPHNHAYFDPRTSAYTLRGNNMTVELPINGRAMVKASDVIFVAGEQMKFREPTWRKYEDAYTGKLGGTLLAVSLKDGKVAASYKLPAAPAWDSIAIARGQLYISLADGTIQCMGERNMVRED